MTKAEIRELELAAQREENERSRVRTRQLCQVMYALKEDAAAALDQFVEANPKWRGAQWADVLDTMLACDAFCDRYEDYDFTGLPEAERPYAWMVAMTLYFASGEKGWPNLERISYGADRALHAALPWETGNER